LNRGRQKKRECLTEEGAYYGEKEAAFIGSSGEDSAMIDQQAIDRYIEQSIFVQSLKDRLKTESSTLTAMGENLKNLMAASGLQNMSLSGGRGTLYVTTVKTMKTLDAAGVAEALKEHGHEDLLRANSTTLKSLIRELEEDGSDPKLLEAILPHVQVSEFQKVVLRKG
jgi:hypothetical protein